MVMTASPGEPYFAHAMKVCTDLNFRAIAVISLAIRLSPDDLAAAGVREADLVIEPLLRRAAELGHAEAQFNLGALHAGGVFVDYDDREAIRWYRKAADQGHAEGAYQVVKYLRLDPSDHRMTHVPALTDDDYGRLLGTAAAGGRTHAVYLHGAQLYDQGSWERGALFECRPGFLLIEQTARLGHRPAMERLAAIHLDDNFGTLGARWLRAAAQAAFLHGDVEEAQELAERSSWHDGSILDDTETVLASILRTPVQEVGWRKLINLHGGSELAFQMASRVAEEADWEGGGEAWMRIAANLGHGLAAYRLGEFLDDYWAWRNDLDAGVEAAEHFAQAARLEVPGALKEARKVALQLAEHFEGEEGREADDEAQQWFEQAVALGCHEASYALGYRLLQPGPRHDPSRAFPLLLESAEAGFPPAKWEVAECLRQGIGVGTDPVQAVHWYRHSADLCVTEAGLHIGRAHRDGVGAVRDLGKALTWLGAAAEDGIADAQFELGLMRLEGLGTPADREAALCWLRAAADQGHAPSLAKIAELEQAPADSAERFVVIDFETTGLSPNKGDRVIEVGAVEIVDGRIGRRFQSLGNPGFPVSARITEITGITNAMLVEAPPLADVMRQVATFIDGAILVAHNASFDHRFLQAEMERLALWNDLKMLCTMQIGKRAYPGLASYKLAALASHAGVALPETLHRALADATVTAELFLLMRKQEVSPPVMIEAKAIHDFVVPSATAPPTPAARIHPSPPPPSGWRRWMAVFN